MEKFLFALLANQALNNSSNAGVKKLGSALSFMQAFNKRQSQWKPMPTDSWSYH